MAGPKPQRLDYASALNSNAKRSKSEPLSPHKMAATREGADVLQELLSEIRGVKDLVKANGEALSTVQEEIAALHGKIENLTLRQDKAEAVLATHGARLEKVDKLEKQLHALQREMEDSNNRARRNNIRMIGLPEGVEGKDMQAFLIKVIPELLRCTFEKDFEIDRAHRVPSFTTSQMTRPRPVVFRVLRFQHATQIMELARARAPIEYEGCKLSFFPDLAKITVNRRKKLLEFRPRLQQLQARFGLLYPAKMRITLHNQTRTFEEPDMLAAFLDEKEAAQMR